MHLIKILAMYNAMVVRLVSFQCRLPLLSRVLLKLRRLWVDIAIAEHLMKRRYTPVYPDCDLTSDLTGSGHVLTEPFG